MFRRPPVEDPTGQPNGRRVPGTLSQAIKDMKSVINLRAFFACFACGMLTIASASAETYTNFLSAGASLIKNPLDHGSNRLTDVFAGYNTSGDRDGDVIQKYAC